MQDPYETATRYGVQFSGELVGLEYHEKVDWSNGDYTLAEVAEAKGRITRVRILAERGRGDISYVHATLPDGTIVPVNLCWCDESIGFATRDTTGMLLRWAKAEKVYAKGINLLDTGIRSVMW